MPPIIPNEAQARVLAGAGANIVIDPDTLRRVAGVLPNDRLTMHYTVELEDGVGVIAVLNVNLDDQHGLFKGYTVMQVLALLQAQLVAERLA